MILTLKRRQCLPGATLGELYVDGVWECYVLEDPVRRDDPATSENEGAKIPGQTAIPAGRYPVVLDWSPRFATPLPHVLNVPNFTGIRIHAGNGPEDTEGCILVGRAQQGGKVLNSRAALNPLIAKIREGLKAGDVALLIEDA